MMKKYFTLIFASLGVFWATAQEVITFDIEEQYRKGVALMNANQYAQALDYIYECQRSEQKNTDFLNKLGYCYFQLGNYREAKYSFRATLELDSLNISALSNLAAISERELNYAQARKYYGTLIEIDSTNSYYFRQQALIVQKQGDLLAATALFGKAHQINEKDLATISDLANAYLQLKALDYAQTVIDKGMQLDSGNIRILYTNARICNAYEDYPGIIRSVKRAMLLGDSTAYYQMMLGSALLKTDSLNQAIDVFERLIKWEKDSEHTHHYLALAYELQENTAKSIEHFKMAIEKGISKKVPRYHRDLAELYEKKEQFQKAYRHYLTAYDYKADKELLFHIAHNADRYYKDKKIALRYYQKYAKTKDAKFRNYTLARIEQLKEIIHQRG